MSTILALCGLPEEVGVYLEVNCLGIMVWECYTSSSSHSLRIKQPGRGWKEMQSIKSLLFNELSLWVYGS